MHPNDLCPRCRRGRRIVHTYDVAGVEHHDDYCGFCGRNLPPADPLPPGEEPPEALPEGEEPPEALK